MKTCLHHLRKLVQIDRRGSVIIFFAILVAVLVAFLALGIDLFVFASQRAKYDRTAEHAALAAIERYIEEIGVLGSSPQDALDAAVLAAEQIVQTNLQNYFGTSFTLDSAASLSDMSGESWGNAGRIVPGIWHFFETPAAANCDQPGSPFQPCFESVAKSQRANSIRIDLRVPSASPLRVLFASLVPKTHRTFTTSAVASLSPRRGVFLIDLSPSITRDTHIEGAGPGADSEYAFYVDSTKNSNCAAGWQSSFLAAVQPIYDDLPVGSRNPAESNPTVHHQGDYQCFTINETSESFGIDTKVNPQPLTGVLDAIHEALEAFDERGVSADRVGIAGFDDEILPVRKMDMVMPELIEPTFTKFFESTDTSTGIEDRYDTYLFPRFFGKERTLVQSGVTVTSRTVAMTDLHVALSAAKDMIINSPGYEISDNFIVLISDGMGNCVNQPPTGYTADCFSNADGNPTATEAYVKQAVDEAVIFGGQLKQNAIKLHVFLIGQEVGPHQLMRKDESGCMSDESARFVKPDPLLMVDYLGGTITPADGQPIYYPNRLYEAARTTNGLWQPIVDCCRTGGACNNSAEQIIDQACDNFAGSVGDLVTCNCAGAGCPVHCNWVGPSGRLNCNTGGKSQSELVKERLQEIMRNNPFVLVD